MNPFLLTQTELLAEWKLLRKSLSKMPEMDQLRAVAMFWSQAPLKKFAYDAERADAWPTPWEMMHTNDWDQNALAIGMEFTLRLSGWSPDRLVLEYIRDPAIPAIMLVLRVDDRYLLNYFGGAIEPADGHEYVVICSWLHDGKKFIDPRPNAFRHGR